MSWKRRGLEKEDSIRLYKMKKAVEKLNVQLLFSTVLKREGIC